MSASDLKADVFVAGGGMAGLTIAAALGSAGIETIAIDRETPATSVDAAFDGRASALADASIRLLESIGVWRQVREAEPIREIRVADGDSVLFLHYDHRELGDRPFGAMVENREIRRALHARLAELPSVRLLAPAQLAAVERGPYRVEARLGDGRTAVAALCIGADGRNSSLREQAGIRCLTWDYRQTGIVCTVAHERPHRGVAVERFLPAGPFAILPLTGNRCSLVWTEQAELAPAILALDEAGFAAELAERFGEHLGALTPIGPRWSYPLSFHHAQRYIDRRLALIGDAAHGIHPIAGQGFNMGLRDIAALAELIVDDFRLGLDLGNPDMLERYQRWRRTDNVVLGAVTDGLNRLFSNDIAPVRLARDAGLAVVQQIPPLKRVFMRHAMGSLGTLPRLLRGEAL